MPRATILILSNAIALWTVLATGVSFAQCADAAQRKDSCSEQKCRVLQDAINDACKVDKRACNRADFSGIVGADKIKAAAALRVRLNQTCYEKRVAIEECYRMLERGHEQQKTETRNAKAKCEEVARTGMPK
jgi:hypothetical protein